MHHKCFQIYWNNLVQKWFVTCDKTRREGPAKLITLKCNLPSQIQLKNKTAV